MKQVYELDKNVYDEIMSKIDKVLTLQDKHLKENDSLPSLMTDIETQKYLGANRKTLLSWDRDNILTRHKVGGKVYYKMCEL